MKKAINLLVCAVIIMTSICVAAGATGNNTVECEANGIEYTVEFEDPALTEEKKVSIANDLIGTNESEIMTANLLCSLFGHDYKYTTASVTQHKASSIAPRCKYQSYDVTYCSRCDYTEQKLVAVNYIDCCPED